MNEAKSYNKIKLLLISPDFDYANGVTRHLRALLKLLSECNNFEVHFITNRGDALSELIHIKNIKYSVFPFSHFRLNLIKHISFYRYLINYCKINNIQIIHNHHRYPEFISYLISKRLNIKTVTTAHSIVNGLRLFSFKSDLIIAVSNSVRNHIIQNFKVPSSRIFKIYNCILSSDYYINVPNPDHIRKELNIKQDDFVIFFNGRINKTKGVDLLLNAFELLQKNNQNLKLLLVGVVEDTSITSKLPKNVYLFNSKKDISRYYLISNIIILPSRVDPYPYVMLEAGLFTKPFIGSRVDGIAEFIEDHVDGILFNTDDVEDLFLKINFAYDNMNQMKEMAVHLNNKVKTNCNCCDYIIKLKNIYNQVLSF